MRRFSGQIVVVGLLVLAWAGAASAFQFCIAPTNFGNVFKFEVTQFGPYFALHGSERVFAERATYGTAYVVPNSSTVRMGFSHIANDGPNFCDINWNVSLNLSSNPPSGPYTARIICGASNGDLSGTMTQVACGAIPSPTNGLPDAGAR